MNAVDGTVVLDVPMPTLEKALHEALGLDGKVIYTASPDATPEAIAQQNPSVDVLILAPQPIPPQSADDAALLTWENLGEPALRRCIGLMTTMGAGMAERGHGVILVIGGLSGLTGWPGWTLTSALEGALVAMTRSLACEWAAQGVRVVFLAAGPMEEALVESGAETLTLAAATTRTPLKRLATPADIAHLAQYIVGERGSFLTGTPVRVDGGWTSWGLLK
jgi:NAD(P)-dependent dehydrogenase (short-subunit alcohol dehydrogenase family)